MIDDPELLRSDGLKLQRRDGGGGGGGGEKIIHNGTVYKHISAPAWLFPDLGRENAWWHYV